MNPLLWGRYTCGGGEGGNVRGTLSEEEVGSLTILASKKKAGEIPPLLLGSDRLIPDHDGHGRAGLTLLTFTQLHEINEALERRVVVGDVACGAVHRTLPLGG